MYQKLSDLQTIFHEQQQAEAQRMNRIPGQTPGLAEKPGNAPATTPAPATGSTSVPPPASGMAVSLADARALPQNKGKSDADITSDIKAHGHAVVP